MRIPEVKLYWLDAWVAGFTMSAAIICLWIVVHIEKRIDDIEKKIDAKMESAAK